MGMGMPPMGGGGAPGMSPIGAMPNGRVPWFMQYGAGMQYGVAMQQQAAIQAYFYQIDTDRNGTLDNGELGRALAAGGMPLTPEVVGTLMQVFDLDRNGTIGMFEWVPLFQFTQKIKESYAMHDRDRSGTLEWNELGAALGSLGMHISPQHLLPLMGKFDPQKTGHLTMDNYTALSLYLANLRTFFDNAKWKRQSAKHMKKQGKKEAKAAKKAAKYGGNPAAAAAGHHQETAALTFDELVGASQYFLA